MSLALALVIVDVCLTAIVVGSLVLADRVHQRETKKQRERPTEDQERAGREQARAGREQARQLAALEEERQSLLPLLTHGFSYCERDAARKRLQEITEAKIKIQAVPRPDDRVNESGKADP